ncbi:hypothetical protein Scep_015219 [Stephania cephalantha]|uniref:Uncharacterized protein n=1 Tax=Stephania cephalantha TaxID=152367 RepID=A0AAP0J2V3_9MAGN
MLPKRGERREGAAGQRRESKKGRLDRGERDERGRLERRDRGGGRSKTSERGARGRLERGERGPTGERRERSAPNLAQSHNIFSTAMGV